MISHTGMFEVTKDTIANNTWLCNIAMMGIDGYYFDLDLHLQLSANWEKGKKFIFFG